MTAEHFFYRKKQLLLEMKIETLQQLEAIQNEDAEQFLQRVEKCERIIELVNQMDSQGNSPSPSESTEINDILHEIIEIRHQINPLLIPLRDKLQQKTIVEKKATVIQQGYGESDSYQPSIFFDKKN